MQLDYLIPFITYLSAVCAIAFVSHRKSQSESDFILGGRSVNYWVTALTAQASDMSSWLFMGLPMAVFLDGLGQAWIAVGLVTGMFLNWHLVAPKLRRLTEELDACTLSTFFSRRFQDPKGWIQGLSAAVTLVFMTHYLAAGLISMGFLFESVFGIDYSIGITLATSAVLAYTLFGGYTAVAWADAFQGCFLVIMIGLVPLTAYSHIGGWDAIQEAANQQSRSLALLADWSPLNLVNTLLLMLGWGLGYLGSPHILVKFMGIRDASEIYKAKRIGISWQIVTMSAAICVGLVGIAFFPQGLENPQLVFIEMVKALFHPLFGGFILCAILAATISTMDSQILVISGVLSEDVYRPLIRPHASSKELLRVSRLSLLFSTLLALGIALDGSQTVLDTVFYSWTGLGASFGPVVLAALFFPWASRWGACTGMAVATLTVLILGHGGIELGALKVPTMVPAFGLGLLSLTLVSLLGREHTSSK